MGDLLAKAGVHGYANRLSVAPGEPIEFKVSCEQPGDYRADIVRLLHGDTIPGGPGLKDEKVESSVSGSYPGRRQVADAGSCVVVTDRGALSMPGAFTLQAFVYPTLPGADGQVLLGRYATETGCGYALLLEGGTPTLVIGGEEEVSRLTTGEPLVERCWYSIAAAYDPETGDATIACRPVVNTYNSRLSPIAPIAGAARISGPIAGPAADAEVAFVIAGACRAPGDRRIDSHFNGKLDSPRIWSRALTADELDGLAEGNAPRDGLVAHWDFAQGISRNGIPTDRVVDTGPGALDGVCVNFPARAMTGWNWMGKEEHFVYAPQQYGAIHFHDDDLEDAGWETDITWTVPGGLRSGAYALRVAQGENLEHFPFIVLPPRGTATAKAAFLVPTMSYLAYANEHEVFEAPIVQAVFGHTSALSDHDLYLNEHPELGASTYDLHTDGSGVHASTALRPIIGLRPGHRAGTGGPWQFPADLHLVDWLDAMDFEVDFVTDRELHDEGAELLKRYSVVLTGTHPEYVSGAMLDAWETYLAEGGRAMYMGGNGFYWVTNWHPTKPHLIELRRGELGTRAWQAEPGEYHLQTNGERGGLWRGRARTPQKLFGVGFSTQGFDVSSSFVQLPDVADPAVAFIMDGIAPDERIGDFGLIGDGASGYEMDRYDLALGTPPAARLLAYSDGHSDNYQHVVEEVPLIYPHLGGTMDFQVRGDIVYFPTQNGGGVFSAGSIAWCASLSHSDYDNNVSRMTANVLRRFLDATPL